MSDRTPRLIHYLQISNRAPIAPPGLWVAIIGGNSEDGGDGIVVAAPTSPVVRMSEEKIFEPGDEFIFGGDAALNGGTIRNVWGLDAVPPEIAGAWMKLLHLGKLRL